MTAFIAQTTQEMFSDEHGRRWTVVHDGREFEVTIEERYSGMATGGLGRIAVSFWKITTTGYAPYLSGRAVGPQDQSFFRDLVAKEWPEMQKGAEGN
ncbi:MAG: hypothetical protein ABJF01_18815 [bacterium]